MTSRSPHRLLFVLVAVFFVSLAQLADRSKAQTQPTIVAVPDNVVVHGIVVPSGANALDNDIGSNLVVTYSPGVQTPLGHALIAWNGNISFIANSQTGTVSVPYSITSAYGSGGGSTSTVTFDVRNTPPTPVTDVFEVVGSGFVTTPEESVLANDFDADGDGLHTSYQGLTSLGSGLGSYSLMPDGRFTYVRGSFGPGVLTVGYPLTDSLGVTRGGVIVLIIHPSGGANNAGDSCPVVAEPVNVTTGNMWLQQADYSLPGSGEFIRIDRFYNSVIQASGLFGLGWSTQYDESLTDYGDKLVRLNSPDGQALYFYRTDTSSPFQSARNESQGQIVKHADNSYTLTFQDGRIHDFDQSGRLFRQTDRNGNQTTLTYDSNNLLERVK